MNIAALLAGLLSGIAGAMGLGGGGVLIIYLTLLADLSQQMAAGINLIFFIPISILAVIIYAFKGEIKWKTVGVLALFGFLGAAVGLWVTGFFRGEILSRVFGGILILTGLKQIFAKNLEKKDK